MDADQYWDSQARDMFRANLELHIDEEVDMFTHPAPVSNKQTIADGLAGFFLARLRRLVALRPDRDESIDLERLRSKAIYSTYLDCCSLGLKDEAMAILAVPVDVPAAARTLS